MSTVSPRKGKRFTVYTLISILSVAGFFLIWHGLVSSGIIPHTLLESPFRVIETFRMKLYSPAPDGATLFAHFKTSLILALVGYLTAVVVGVPLGLLMGWYKTLDNIVKPLFEIVRPIPPIAWIPLTIFWLGIGMTAKAYIIWLSAFVPAVINSYHGVKYTEPVLVNVARTFGASSWEIFLRICVPSALPMVFAGLTIALSCAWTTLVAAELVAATEGLGYMIQMGRALARSDIIIVGMLTIGFTGAAMAWILERFERYFAPWRRS